MRRVGIVVGLLISASGVVWMLQGLNSRYAPRSFMTDNRQWILYGAVAVVAGMWLAAWSRRRQ